MKGKERVPVPVAGPAFRGGVKFIMFYMLGSFLKPAPEVGSIQRTLSPVCYPRLWSGQAGGRREGMRGQSEESKGGRRKWTYKNGKGNS